jgi:hypothetical protein
MLFAGGYVEIVARAMAGARPSGYSIFVDSWIGGSAKL